MKNESISPTTRLINQVEFGENVTVEDFCLIGKLSIEPPRINEGTTSIGNDCYIGAYSSIGSGASLGDHCVCTEYTSIGINSQLQSHVKVQYKAQIHKRVKIGAYSRIGGFCCNDSIIGERCTVYGSLVHHYPQHGGTIGAKPPILENDVIVAFEAVVVGEITIGRGSYIAPGAIVTRNVPANTVVTGVNQFTCKSQWPNTLPMTTTCADNNSTQIAIPAYI